MSGLDSSVPIGDGAAIIGAGIGANIGAAGIAGAIDAGTGMGGANGGGANGAIDAGIGSGIDAGIGSAIDAGIGGAIDAGIGSGIDAGIGSGDDDDARNEAPVTTAIGAGVRSGASDAVVTNGLRSSGSAIGSVEDLVVLALALALGATDAEARGATDSGAGGATEGARGAIGAWLARGGIDAGLADADATGEAPVMRCVPGDTLATGALLSTLLIGSRSFESSASASAMSGGSPCAVAASSWPPRALTRAGALAAGATPAIVLRPAPFERTALAGRGTGDTPSAFSFRPSDPTAAPIRKLK